MDKPDETIERNVMLFGCVLLFGMWLGIFIANGDANAYYKIVVVIGVLLGVMPFAVMIIMALLAGITAVLRRIAYLFGMKKFGKDEQQFSAFLKCLEVPVTVLNYIGRYSWPLATVCFISLPVIVFLQAFVEIFLSIFFDFDSKIWSQ